REEVDERAVGPRRGGSLTGGFPGLAQGQEGQHVARLLGVPGLGEGAGLGETAGGQVLHDLAETRGGGGDELLLRFLFVLFAARLRPRAHGDRLLDGLVPADPQGRRHFAGLDRLPRTRRRRRRRDRRWSGRRGNVHG